MPSISVSHPPATWRTRCPPPPSAAAQPASTPPRHESSFSTLVYGFFSPDFRHVAVKVFSATIVSFYLLCFVAVCFRYPLISATFDEAFALAFLGVLFFLFFFYSIISAFLYPPLLDPKTRALRRLDPTIIRSFPTVLYSAVKGHKIGEASLVCAVCLSDFEDHDTLRLIPKCHHAFHPDCIGKWLASRSTCPVCRANLTSQPAGDWASQLSTELLQVEVKVEAAPPDGGAPERSPQEGRRERIQPPDLGDKNESSSFSNRNETRSSSRIHRFPRSHSTGHSLVRPGEDFERFTLRLPAEAWKQLMDRPGPVLLLEGCSRRGYRCGVEGTSGGRYFRRPDQLDRAAKSERWDFSRISPRVAGDGGGGSSGDSVRPARPAI